MSITFKEGTLFTAETSYSRRTYAPVHMVKDGKEYFVQNRLLADPDPAWGRYAVIKASEDSNSIKEFLTANDGKYICMYGDHKDPLEMLKNISENGYTFTTPGSMFTDCRENGGFVDFHGNLCEVSAAFMYRFYDMELMKKVYTAVDPLIRKSLQRK